VLIIQSQQRPFAGLIICIEPDTEQGKLPRGIPPSFAVYSTQIDFLTPPKRNHVLGSVLVYYDQILQ
jgi:hypothetical protein